MFMAMFIRNRRSSVPLEVVVLCGATLAFLALIRLSGTFGQVYNQDRAQIQAGMVLCISLALVVSWFAKRSPRLTTAVAVISLLLLGATVPAGSSGLVGQLGSGGSPLLENGGTSYNTDYMTQQEVAAARWLAKTAGHKPLIYTDEFGELRIFAGTKIEAQTQTLLTPATIAPRSWVFATGYNLDGTAYGIVYNNDVSTYRFPSAFLNRVKSTVYSSPGARVYR
jgi:predicted PurR-regulated permease PerM